jgi:cysteine-rich repeat protein
MLAWSVAVAAACGGRNLDTGGGTSGTSSGGGRASGGGGGGGGGTMPAGGAGALGGTGAQGGGIGGGGPEGGATPEGGFGAAGDAGEGGGEPTGACGDGTVDTGEACDDGNQRPGDGCSRSCRPEPVALSLGHMFACALSSIGTVKCWGMNYRAQLGAGDTEHRGDEPGEMGAALPFVNLGTGRWVRKLVSGYAHSCALLDDHTVKCWGDGGLGQIGDGTDAYRGNEPGEMGDDLPVVDLGTGRTVLDVATKGEFTCALLDDHSVKCWGDGYRGKLGQGDDESRGDEPGEMGDALPVVPLGAGRTARSIVVGNRFACAWLDNDRLRCWGWDLPQTEELGMPLPTALVADDNLAAVYPDGTIRCWGAQYFTSLCGIFAGAGRRASDLSALELDPVRTVSAGWGFKCAVLVDGSLKCWGRNDVGQLGLGDIDDRGDARGEMGDALPRVDLGTGRTARFVATGARFSCAILNDATVKCWGPGNDGATGYGNETRRGDDPGEMGDALPTVDLVF